MPKPELIPDLIDLISDDQKYFERTARKGVR